LTLNEWEAYVEPEYYEGAVSVSLAWYYLLYLRMVTQVDFAASLLVCYRPTAACGGDVRIRSGIKASAR
jgi:hypothetical protein